MKKTKREREEEGGAECEGQHVKAGSVLTRSHVREPGVCERERLELLTSPHDSHTHGL